MSTTPEKPAVGRDGTEFITSRVTSIRNGDARNQAGLSVRVTTVRVVLLCLIAEIILLGCNSPPTIPDSAHSYFLKYKSASPHKAFAIVRATAGDGWAGNYSSGYSTTEAAKQAALAGCRDYAKTLNYVMSNRCTIYAVDDDIVLPGSDFVPTLPTGGVEGH